MYARLISLIVWSACATFAAGAQDKPAPTQAPAPAAGQKYIEKTVCVPEWVTETRTCKETHYRWEIREKPCTTYHEVTTNKEVPCEYTVFVRVHKTVEREIELSKPAARWVDHKYTDYVPGKATVTRTRTIRKCVPVTEKKTVCIGGQTKEIEVTTNKMVCIEEPYQCEISVCVPIEKTCKLKEYYTKKVPQKVTDRICTVEPRTRSRTVTACVTERIPETKMVTCRVCVPYTVEKQVQVRVCKMVPKTVRVPVCGN